MMSTIPSCMGQYINQYMITPGPQPGYYRPQGGNLGVQQQQQHHNYMVGCYQNANGWAGVPLISTATRRPRKQQQFQQQQRQNNDFDENAMTRLALHAHGAPLILAGRYWNNKTVHQRRNEQKEADVTTITPPQPQQLNDECSSSSSSTSSLTTVSVGLNSINSQDMCLPRIIKPRKRRKKDRKPVVNQPDESIIKLDTTTKQPVDSPKLITEDLISSCSCRLCDPYCKIWAFPLRRSCSDNSAEIEQQKVKDVGVIGSNRLQTVRNEWRSTPHSINDSMDYTNSRKGSFSDSGDSGCDILSGIYFTDDILCGAAVNEDVNAITKRLNDSLDIKSDSECGSVISDSVFGDSDIDPVVHGLISGTNLIFNNLVVNQSEPLVFVQEKDMGSEIYNCFDMVWNGEENLQKKMSILS